MYIVFKEDKAEHLKHKAYKMKELACEVLECLEAHMERRHESSVRDMSRRNEMSGSHRRYEDDYDDEDYDYEEEKYRNKSRSSSSGRSNSRY